MKIRVIRRGDKQYLEKKHLWFFWRIIDSETIPDHVMISMGCFGDTGGWKSKFKEHIK